MLDQPGFADLDYQHKRHKTRREQFLERLGALVLWSRLEARTLPHYPKAGKGRRPYPSSMMLRVHMIQICHNLSDPAMEDLLYEAESVRRFVGLRLPEPIPDESTTLHFRHLLERRQLGHGLFEETRAHLGERGMTLREGTIVDATINQAPASTKNREGQRDPEMRQVKKGNQYPFGMKLHIGVDAETGLVHSMVPTPANVHDVTRAVHQLRGEETQVWGDAGYTGVQKREDNQGLTVRGQVALKLGKRKNLEPDGWAALVGQVKASVRAKVEHPFWDVKGIFHYAKSLPPSPIGGTIPGLGQEHRPSDPAAGTFQPDPGPETAGGLTQGVVRPKGPTNLKSGYGRGPSGKIDADATE